MYNREFNVLFIHVPKTAGKSMWRHTFIGGRQRRIEGRHQPAIHYKRKLELEEWKSIFKFGFVRHPLDRLVSAYFREAREGLVRDKQGFTDFVIELVRCDLFPSKSWVGVPQKGMRQEALFRPKVHFWPQWYFLMNKSGRKVLVDFIGRFERLKEDWREVCRRSGVAHAPLSHDNKGEHEPYRSYYTSETERLARKIYAKDFEVFGY